MSEYKTIKININATDKEIEAAVEAAVAYELDNGGMSALNVEFVHEEENLTSAGSNLKETVVTDMEFDEFMDMVKDVEFTGDINDDLEMVEELYRNKQWTSNCTNGDCDNCSCDTEENPTKPIKLEGCTFKMARKAVKRGAVAMRGDETQINFLTQEDIEADDWIIIW